MHVQGMSRACPVLFGERHSVFWETRALSVAFLQSSGWLQDPCWSSQRHLKSKFILEAEMLRTRPKNLAKQGRHSQPRVSWLPGNHRWAQGDTDDDFCHLLLCCPLLEGTSGEYVIGPFVCDPTETGIVNPNSPGHMLLFSHIRGTTATPWGSPRGLHRQFEVRPLTHGQATNPSQPPQAHQRHCPKRGKKILKSLRHEGQLLLSDK